MAEKQEPYDLTPAFERALITTVCKNPSVYARLGDVLEEGCLVADEAKLALRAAQAIAEETGVGPKSLLIVIQRLRRWMADGKQTQEAIDNVNDYFDEAEDAGLPEEEAIVKEVAPLLQRRAQGKAVRSAIDTFGKRGDMTHVATALNNAERIGEGQRTIGLGLEGAFEEIETIAHLQRLPFGIPEVDLELEGGFERGSLWMFMGGAGDGKSMALVQLCCSALLSGVNVSYATLEISRARTFARIIANLTGIPTNAILNGHMEDAKKCMADIGHRLAKLRLEYFSPGGTTIEDIQDFNDRSEQKDGIAYDAVIVDYGDKLVLPEKQAQSGYHDFGKIWETYRTWMEATNKWGGTASQTKEQKETKKKVDIGGAADSRHKGRVTDGAISLNVEEHGTMCTYHVAKNRNGVAHQSIGPLATDFACARIGPVNRDYERWRQEAQGDEQSLFA